MQKIISILALILLLSANASAADRDCAQYNASQALSATEKASSNTFSATFSGMALRRGTTNADCAKADTNNNTPTESSVPEEQAVSNNTPAESSGSEKTIVDQHSGGVVED